MTFNILTDSTADLDEKWAQENKVELVGLTITLDDIAYETVGPNRLTSGHLLERMQEGSQKLSLRLQILQRQQVGKVISLSWRQKLVTKVRAYLKRKP